MPTDHVNHNREFWDEDADAYQELHGATLAAQPLAWGAWRRPEAELRILGDVGGRDMLELGCGAAQWSVALTRAGARCVAMDLSIGQLRHARAHCTDTQVSIPLVLASGERLPFADASFDIVFCDHGAMSFCDPARSVPEAARVLRPGGLLAFCTTHPLVYLTWNSRRGRQSRKLHRPYDRLGLLAFDDGTVDWALAPGAWMRVLRAHGFEIEDLIELQAPEGATTTFVDYVPDDWAQQWPAEEIWRAVKGRRG